MSRKELPRIGVALSGGTLKAAAHVGVLAALEELGIRPDCVAGTSAGSLVAALYAHGYTTAELLRLVQDFPGRKLFDYGFPLLSSVLSMWHYARRHGVGDVSVLPSGLLRGRRLLHYFRQMLDDRTAHLPYYIVATDLISSRPIVFTNDTGAVAKHVAEAAVDPSLAVLGSCALPGVFPPVRIPPWLLVDGAFRHYVPVDILRQVGCRKIVVVNLYRLERNWRPRSVVHVLTRSYEILLQESIDNDISGDDILMIRPDVGDMSWLSFHELGDCVRSGRRAVTTHAQRIRAWIEREEDLADVCPASNTKDREQRLTPWIVRIH